MSEADGLTDGQKRLQRMVDGKHTQSPCGLNLALPVVHGYDEKRIWYEWSVEERFLNSNGHLFGGYLSALMDDALGHAGCTVVEDGQVAVTSDLRVSYFRPLRPEDGPVRVEASIVNQSRRQLFAEAQIISNQLKLIAKATGVLSIVPAISQ